MIAMRNCLFTTLYLDEKDLLTLRKRRTLRERLFCTHLDHNYLDEWRNYTIKVEDANSNTRYKLFGNQMNNVSISKGELEHILGGGMVKKELVYLTGKTPLQMPYQNLLIKTA